MSDLAFVLGGALLLALPGLGGYAFAVWRARGALRPSRAWVAFAVPTAALVLFWAGCWLWARAMERAHGYDDGSVPMSLTVLVATVVVNVLAAAVLLAWNRRTRRSTPRREGSP